MAISRRKSGGCTRGRFKVKKMGKGWSSYRPKMGFRPKPNPPKTAEEKAAAAAEKAKAKANAES